MGVSSQCFGYIASGYNYSGKAHSLHKTVELMGATLVAPIKREISKKKEVLNTILKSDDTRTIVVPSWKDIYDLKIMELLYEKHWAVIIANEFKLEEPLPPCGGMYPFRDDHPVMAHAMRNRSKIERSVLGRQHENKMSNQNKRNLEESAAATEHAKKLVEAFFEISKEHNTLSKVKICKIANEKRKLRTRKTDKAPKGNPILDGNFKRFLKQAGQETAWSAWETEFKEINSKKE
ncbi:hypothetical protein [Terasakiella pusilla]|uniref:hypothetical protein n=1 Tax=Terasakiella pusilla TaxID=64973 RepID=UPI003AA7AE5C